MPTKRQKHTMRHANAHPVRRQHKKCCGGNIISLFNVIPNDIKRQLATQLAKDLTLRVALPIGTAIGAKKLYNRHKKK